jgi:predicted dehydrogenase
MKELHLAVVGCGAFGTRYLDSLRTLPGVVVKWVCDLDETRAADAAAKFGSLRWTSHSLEALDDPEVDAAVVVTPENAHRAVAVAAFERGKHVIVEKPLATTEEDSQAMLAAARASGKLLMIGFLLRFDYRYARLHQRLSSIGTVRNIYAWRNFDRSLFELYSRTHSFIENAIHDIDLILWCVRDRAVRTHGYCRTTQGRENPDINWGVIEFERGALAVLQTSWMYPPQPHDILQWNAGLQVMGDHGVLEVRMDADGFRAHTESDGQTVLDQTGWAVIHDEPRGAFGAMLRHFMAALRGDVPYAGTPPEEAVASMRIACDLANDAARREGTG